MVDGAKRTGAFAWLAAIVVPPVVAGGLGQQFVARHALAAVLIGVVYEAVVAVGGFLAVIAREVSSRWQERLAERVDLLLRRSGPRFERQYRLFVRNQLRFTDTKGLVTVGDFTPEHQAVYVDVSLVRRPPQQIQPGILPDMPDAPSGRYAVDHFLDSAEPVVLAVVGAPGSGKTTLLRDVARRANGLRRSRWGRRRQVRDIPVLLYLRDHAGAIVADPTVSVGTLIIRAPGLAVEEDHLNWFEQQLGRGRCVILLDGLDEVARPDDRVKVSAWANAQVLKYPLSSFVISSRPQGYLAAPVEGAIILQVCGFTPSQVERFVHVWYRATERHSTGTAGPEADALAAQEATDLLQRLGRVPALYALASNPLLLTMIVNVHRYRRALPGSRADLYSEICQATLWRRQEAKQLHQQVSGDKKEAVLASLAYTMMERRVSDLSHADVTAVIQPFLRRVPGGVTPDDFLADVSSNGLLIERETGQYSFAHKTFQEYLATTHIREHGLVSVLSCAVGDDWWAETVLLYVAKSTADPIIEACLDDGGIQALALAFDCVDQGSDVDPGIRGRLDATIASAASPGADPGDRRRFAAILLRRHIRQRIRISGDSEVCLQPVPADIYRLFLADTTTPAPDAPPTVTGAAVGMRGSDAKAFVRWANDVSGAEHAFRLPLAAELGELAARYPVPSSSGRPSTVWAQSDEVPAGSPPVLWRAPGTPDPHGISKVLLASAIREDAKRSAPTLSGILLLRTRVLIYALNRALDQVRDDHVLDLSPARQISADLDRDLDRARNRALGHLLDDHAVAIARELGQIRDRNHHLALNHAQELGQARALAKSREHELNKARAETRNLTQDRSQAITEARTTKHELNQARARERELNQIRIQATDPVPIGKLFDVRYKIQNLEYVLDHANSKASDLDSQITQARTRERGLAQAYEGSLEPVREHALALDIAQANDRDHILALARESDRAAALSQDRLLSDALDLDHALACSLADDLTVGPVGRRGLDLASDLTLDRRLARAREQDSSRDSILTLAIALTEAADRHALWRSLSNSVLPKFEEASGYLLGKIFSLRFTEASVTPNGSTEACNLSPWPARLAEEFTAATEGAGTGHVTVDPETLETTLEQSVTNFIRILSEKPGTPSHRWISIIAERLRQSTGPVFARTEQPAAGKATADRLAAICLASEADEMNLVGIGAMFRRIAAGITFMEHRATGKWPASEVMILTVGPSSPGNHLPLRD